MQLPIAPGKLQTKINNNNKTINLINDGEVNIIKSQGLTDIEFEAMLPNSRYPFSNYFTGFQPSDYFLNSFEKFKVENIPFQFIVCRLKSNFEFLFDTNIQVAMEDYEILEDADNGTDVVVKVKLKQYKDYATKILEVKNNADGSQSYTVKQTRPIKKETPDVHKIIANQTLFEVCKNKLGDGSKWIQIAELNNISNPNNLDVGQVLKFVK